VVQCRKEDWATPLRSSVAVLFIISSGGLEEFERAGNAPSEFLLFIESALADFENGHRLILPLLCDGPDGQPFSNFSTSKYPSSKHSHPQSQSSSTVQATMSALFKLNGRPLPPTVVERTGDCASKLLQAYQSGCHEFAQAFTDRVNRLRFAGSGSLLHLLSYNPGSTRVNNDFTYSGKVCVTSLLTGEIKHTFSIPGSGNLAAFSPRGC